MDMLEHSLDDKDHGHEEVHLHGDVDIEDIDGGDDEHVAAISGSTIALDPSLQYQLRTDGGQMSLCDPGAVTYRVVQVTQNEDGQVVAAGMPGVGGHSMIQSPFSNGESPPADIQDARFTYVPSVSADGGHVIADSVSAATTTLGQVTVGGESPGQFYVMMSPQDVLQAGQRTIAPRTGITPRIEGARTTRDERRRATHNEVERRRRDKINNWIVQLSKLVPDCNIDHTKQGQVSNTSKGGILSKACDHITDLRKANNRMAESLKETERLSVDAELLRQQCEELKQENNILRATLQQHGIVLPELSGPNS